MQVLTNATQVAAGCPPLDLTVISDVRYWNRYKTVFQVVKPHVSSELD